MTTLRDAGGRFPADLTHDNVVAFEGNVAVEAVPDDRDLAAAAPAALDLHVEARSVAARTRGTRDPFEVAVLLATLGYGDERAHELGCDDLFDLAERVVPLLPLFEAPVDEIPVGVTPREAEDDDGPRRMSGRLLGRSLLYSAPWLVAIAALVVSRVSFWATITTQQFSSAISLALFAALILTGGITQAFARRGLFYALQHNVALLRWTVRSTLGLGMVAIFVVIGGGYLLLDRVALAYTPASDRSFLLFGISIGAFLLAFAPLYLARAIGEVLLAAGAGGLVLGVGGRLITHGDYLNPYSAQWVQLSALWVAVLVAAALDVRVLRRLAQPLPGAPHEKHAAVRRPRARPVLHAVGPYAAYGAGFFVLVVSDRLVAGGLWHGFFRYDGRYELAVGLGLLVLVPTLTYGTAASELLPGVARRELAGRRLSDHRQASATLLAFYRRHVLITALVGAAGGGLLLLGGYFFSTVTLATTGLLGVFGFYVAALIAYLLLGIGAFNSGLLFSLGRARVPAVAAWAGAVLSAVVGGLVGLLWSAEPGALVGLLSATASFAVATSVAAVRCFRSFDLNYYRAF